MKRSSVLMVAVAIAALLVSGCAGGSKHIIETPQTAVSYKAEKGQAVVVFMRPSFFGGAISSSVFDISDKEEKFIAIVPAKNKVLFRTSPGQHMFMVVGESADFMKADLQEGKTYYALVTPRIGMWKARFSLRPVNRSELNSAEFKEWFDTCEFVENAASAQDWAKDNAESIKSKREEYIEKWNAKSDVDKPVLNQEDGQ